MKIFSSRYKTGNVGLDMVIIIVVIFILLISTMIGSHLVGEINEDVQNDPDMSNITKETISEFNTDYPALFDGIFVFVFVMLWIAAIVSTFVVDTHPIFFIVSVLLLVFTLIIAMFLGNVYYEISQEEPFLSQTQNFEMSHWIITHPLELGIFIVLSITITLYGKNRFT